MKNRHYILSGSLVLNMLLVAWIAFPRNEISKQQEYLEANVTTIPKVINEKSILAGGGPQARAVIQKALDVISCARVFALSPFPDYMVHAEAWAIDVIVKYDKIATEDLINVLRYGIYPESQLYAIYGLLMLNKNAVSEISLINEFVRSDRRSVSVTDGAAGDGASSFKCTTAEVLQILLDRGIKNCAPDEISIYNTYTNTPIYDVLRR